METSGREEWNRKCNAFHGTLVGKMHLSGI